MAPRFARASNGAASDEGWGDVDNMDVEMLAEYLLDDGNGATLGVTFDFNVEKRESSFVSPENSEDGRLPPVADTSATTTTTTNTTSTSTAVPTSTTTTAATPVTLVNDPLKVLSQGGAAGSANVAQQLMPAALQMPITQSMLSAFPTLPNAIQNLGALHVPAVTTSQGGQTLVLPQQVQQKVTSASSDVGNDAKRRRVDPSVAMASAAGLRGTPIVPGQPLVLSSATATMPTQPQPQGRGRKKSQAQIDRRRERNRILARRTRLRKKFFFESLQKEVMDLQRENVILKELVKTKLPDEKAKPVLSECDAMEKLPEGVLEACGENEEDMDQDDFNLVKSVQRSQHSFVITDPSLQDNPIVFASEGFLSTTGYTREQVLGRNCRFLQGNDTSKEKVETIQKGIATGEDVSVTILNYTAEGQPFWNKLFIAALRDAHNNIVNYIGVIAKVASPEQGDAEYGKMLPGEKAFAEEEEDDGAAE